MSGRPQNRRRLARRARGGCGKRQWRSLDDAQGAIVRALASPGNTSRAVAIYSCPRCGWYHQTRQTHGPDVVLVLEREALDVRPS